MLSILTQFLSSRSKQVMVNGYPCKLVNVVSEVKQGSVFAQLLFLLYISELFSILENKFIGFTDYSFWSLFCHPQVLELQLQSPLIVTSARLVGGVTFWG